MIPSLQWHIFYGVFAEFAAMARQYHFFDEEVDKMEQSLFAMCPYKKKE